MTDDRRDADAMAEMDELLTMADGPVHFPEPARSELLGQLTQTVSMSRRETATIVPFTGAERETSRPRRAWVLGAAAAVVLIVASGLAILARPDGSRSPADQPLQAQVSVDEVCAALPGLAAANGLAGGPVQVGDVSLEDLDEVRRLLDALSADGGGPVDTQSVDDAVTLIRLMEISIEAADTDAAAGAMTAARSSVADLLDRAC